MQISPYIIKFNQFRSSSIAMFWPTFSSSKSRRSCRWEAKLVPLSCQSYVEPSVYRAKASEPRPLYAPIQTFSIEPQKPRSTRRISSAKPQRHSEARSQYITDDGNLIIEHTRWRSSEPGLKHADSYIPAQRDKPDIHDNDYVTSIYQPSANQTIIIERKRSRVRNSSRSSKARTVRSNISNASDNSARSALRKRTSFTEPPPRNSKTPSAVSTPSLCSSISLTPSPSTKSRHSCMSAASRLVQFPLRVPYQSSNQHPSADRVPTSHQVTTTGMIHPWTTLKMMVATMHHSRATSDCPQKAGSLQTRVGSRRS